MAEAAASIAGLASLAIQLTESVATLRRFYRSVRNAPETLEESVFELETVALALKEVERDLLKSNVESKADLLTRCMQSCERGAKKLQQVVDKMQRLQTKARGLGMVYIALKEKDEQALLTDLERAKNSLAFAFQMYTEARRQADAERQGLDMQQISQQLATLPTEVVVHLQSSPNTTTNLVTCIAGTNSTASETDSVEASDAVDTYHTRTAARPSHRRKWTQFKLPLPFCQQIWHLSATRSTGCWEFKIEIDRIRPHDAPIFDLVEKDDLAGVQRLFDLGEASSWDCAPWGDSLLWIASIYGAPQVVRFLLDQRYHAEFGRLWLYAFDKIPSSVRSSAFEWPKTTTESGREDELVRFCLRQGYIEPLNFFDTELHRRHRTADSLGPCSRPEYVSLILQDMPISLSRVSIESKFHCAMGMNPSMASPASLLGVCGLGDVDHALACMKTERGMTALHFALLAIESRWDNDVGLQGWDNFAQSLIENGADVHAPTEEWGRNWQTPLLEVLGLGRYASSRSFKTLLSSLQWWLQLLAAAGIDLLAYGAVESRKCKRFRGSKYAEMRVRRKYSLFDLNYGPTPESWSLLLRPFGKVPVYKEVSMPGAWKDERIPDIICWSPESDDECSRNWVPHSSGSRQGVPRSDRDRNRDHAHVAFGPPQDIRQVIEHEAPSAFEKLVASSQDDHGAVGLLILRSRTGGSRRRRSASQPPQLRRRERAYCTWGRWAHHGPKLSDQEGEYHLCPSDGKHRYGCAGLRSSSYEEVDLRACLASWHSMGASDFEKGPAQIILPSWDKWV